MARILILIGSHLCNAPRPQKEALTLAQAGHDVTIHGVWFDPEFARRDRLILANKPYRFHPILDFQPQHRLTNIQVRFQGRLARYRYSRHKTFNPALLGYGARAHLKAALRAKADLTIVHSEAGLWVGSQLLRQGFRVGVDFEDWFSEDLLPEYRRHRPISCLQVLEQELIRRCHYCLTTSQTMAHALAQCYDAPAPTVIYNSFPWSERQRIDHQIKDRKNLTLPSLHWFSQTIGPGRGLESLFQALPHLPQRAEVHLRGHYPESSQQWLEPQIPDDWQPYIFIHPTVPNTELVSRIAEHDIGLALEIPYCSNKQYTVSNKLFQYLQGGLAVIATDTAGQREIIDQYPESGELIPNQSPVALAQAISHLLSDRKQLSQMKAAALIAAEQLAWENQSSQITSSVNLALRASQGSQRTTAAVAGG